MKDCYLKVRCTEQEKRKIKCIAEMQGMSMSEYILSLVKSDETYYHEVEVFVVVKGINKNVQYIEKGRESLGYIFVDEYNRASVDLYSTLYERGKKLFGNLSNRPNHHLYLECQGEKVSVKNCFTEWVVFGKVDNEVRNY